MADPTNITTLTAARLRELLHYDPETGIFTWRPRPVRVGFERNDRSWNTRYSGKPAGSVNKRRGGDSYRYITVDDTSYLAHRLAWLYMTGEWPADEVDHRNLDGLNNRWGNLREATGTQNLGNTRVNSKNTTGFKGVSFLRRTGRYYAQIRIDHKSRHLGYFDTPEEAHAAYVAAAERYFGEFARAA